MSNGSNWERRQPAETPCAAEANSSSRGLKPLGCRGWLTCECHELIDGPTGKVGGGLRERRQHTIGVKVGEEGDADQV